MPYRAAVTVPDASIGATLTDFPVYVDLSDMPADFWSTQAFADGRDIRVKDALDADLPFHLVHFDPVAQAGALFYKQTLTNGGDTVAYVHWSDGSLSAIPTTDPNGRDAVWADYHRVYFFGSGYGDSTGAGADLTATGAVQLWEAVATSPDTGCHQGVAWDGTHYYTVDDNTIKKYNSSWVLQASNTNPNGDIGTGNHCGDPCVVGGVLYVPSETYPAVANQKIARFNTSDLSYIGSWSVSAQGHEVSSIAYNATDGYLYMSSYNDGTKLWRYNQSTGAYVGQTTMGTTIAQIQGITFFNGLLYVNSDSTNATHEFSIDTGANTTTSIRRVYGSEGGNWEGLDHNDAGLLIFHDTTGSANGVVYEVTDTRRNLHGGGVRFGAHSANVGAYLRATGMTRYTVWTAGITCVLRSKAANATAMSYARSAETDNAVRATNAYRQATDQFGLWNNVDTWVENTGSPSTGVAYRLNAVHNGTTNRLVYKDGTGVTDSGVAARPASNANAFYLGMEDDSLTEPLTGELGFFYLRDEVLSASWLAAESLNLLTPSSFYTVGASEETSEIEVTFATVVGNVGVLTTDAPVEYATVVGSVGVEALGIPMDLVTQILMEAASGGFMDGGGGSGVGGGPLTLTYTTSVGSGAQVIAGEPEALSYATMVSSGHAVTAETPVSYATLCGARSAVLVRPNGRADLLVEKLYRR